jgi:hypothetical protein
MKRAVVDILAPVACALELTLHFFQDNLTVVIAELNGVRFSRRTRHQEVTDARFPRLAAHEWSLAKDEDRRPD